jgi:hypothetical protein
MNLYALYCVLRVPIVIVKRVGVHVHSSGSELMQTRHSVESGEGRGALYVRLVIRISDTHPDIWVSKSNGLSGKVIWVSFNISRGFVNWHLPDSSNELFLWAEEIHDAPSIGDVVFTRSILLNRDPSLPFIKGPEGRISFRRHFSRKVRALNLGSFALRRLAKCTGNLNFKENNHIWVRNNVLNQMLCIKDCISKIMMFESANLQVLPFNRPWGINQISISIDCPNKSALSEVSWKMEDVVPLHHESKSGVVFWRDDIYICGLRGARCLWKESLGLLVSHRSIAHSAVGSTEVTVKLPIMMVQSIALNAGASLSCGLGVKVSRVCSCIPCCLEQCIF